MGAKNGCELKRCLRQAEVICGCSGISLCLQCIELHKRQNPFPRHETMPILTPNKSSSASITSSSLVYLRTLYRSPEGGTEVHEGMVRGRAGKVAIKSMHCPTDATLLKKQREANLMMTSNHPNVCKCLTAFVDPISQWGYKFVLVMEFSENGDLEQDIDIRRHQKDHWPERDVFKHMTDLIGAFSFLQECNLTHGDIKPRNLLMSGEGTLKIGDFGEALQGTQAMVTRTYQVSGTVIYLSPLLFKAYVDAVTGKNVGGSVRHNPIKSDVYSLGLTFLHMLSLKKPSGLNNLSQGAYELQKQVDSAIQDLAYSSTVKQLLTHMLQVTEQKRPDFVQLKAFLLTLQEAAKVKPNKPIVSEEPAQLEHTVAAFTQTPGGVVLYDYVTKRLSKLSNLKFHPSARICVFQGWLLVTGGLKTPKSAFQVSLTHTKTLPGLITGRSNHAVALLNDTVVLIGGRSSDKRSALTQCEAFVRGNWQAYPVLNVPRENAAAATLGSAVFVVGGSTQAQGRWTLLDSVEQLRDGSWRLCEVHLPSPVASPGLLAVFPDKLLLIGGVGAKGKYFAECFEWQGGVFEEVAQLPHGEVYMENAVTATETEFVLLGSSTGLLTFTQSWRCSN